MPKFTKKEMEYQTVLAEEKAYLALRAHELAEAPFDTVERLAWRENDKRYIDLRAQWWAIHHLRMTLGVHGDVYRIAAKRGDPGHEELRVTEERLEAVEKSAVEKRRSAQKGDI